MLIGPEMLEELLAHAREEYDAECCGMIAYDAELVAERAIGSDTTPDVQNGSDGGRAMELRRARNIHASRKRFEIDGLELLHTKEDFEEKGWDLGAIYHSHTHTDPYPSQTDINFAANWPGLEWVIVGLADSAPDVRCYLIDGGEVHAVPLEVA